MLSFAATPTVAALPEGIEGALIMVNSNAAPDVIRECSKAGIKRVWLNHGTHHGGQIWSCFDKSAPLRFPWTYFITWKAISQDPKILSRELTQSIPKGIQEACRPKKHVGTRGTSAQEAMSVLRYPSSTARLLLSD